MYAIRSYYESAEARTEPGAAGSGDLEREVADLRSESFVSSDPGEAPSSSGAPRPSVSLDELDTLPDLDGFSDAFTTTQAGDDEASAPDASRITSYNVCYTKLLRRSSVR